MTWSDSLAGAIETENVSNHSGDPQITEVPPLKFLGMERVICGGGGMLPPD